MMKETVGVRLAACIRDQTRRLTQRLAATVGSRQSAAVWLALWASVITPHPWVVAQTVQPADAARESLEAFFRAWNTADIGAVREQLNYPHLTLVGNRMIVAETAESFTTDFDRMRRDENWNRSSLDSFHVTNAGKGKVHCLVTYSRFDPDGNRYRSSRILYVVTEQDGHWGMQFRMPMGEMNADTPELNHDESRRVLDAFFVHFNNRDNESLQSITNFPHAFLLGGGRVALSSSDRELAMNFDSMAENEGWHRSSLDSFELIGSTGNSAAYEIVFGRHHADDSRYRTVPALWIVTQQAGKWGLQFRSLMPATLSR